MLCTIKTLFVFVVIIIATAVGYPSGPVMDRLTKLEQRVQIHELEQALSAQHENEDAQSLTDDSEVDQQLFIPNPLTKMVKKVGNALSSEKGFKKEATDFSCKGIKFIIGEEGCIKLGKALWGANGIGWKFIGKGEEKA